MDKNITLQTLFSFAYNETEILETIQVIDALEHDEEAIEDYQAILATIELLESTAMEPSATVLNKIFLYSKTNTKIKALV